MQILSDAARPATSAEVKLAWSLILLPVACAVVKSLSGGWIVVFLLFAFPIWGTGWAVAITIAITGFLRTGAAFQYARQGARRAVMAARIHIAGLLIGLLVLPDAGDTSERFGPFGVVIPQSAVEIMTLIAYVLLLAGCIAFVWLVVEWIAALGERRVARQPAPATPTPPQ